MEIVVPWTPIDGTEDQLFLVALRHGADQVLSVELSAGVYAARSLHVEFGFVKAFRLCPQYVYLKAPWFGKLGSMSMYEIHNSSYLQWLAECDPADFEDVSFRHFMFITPDGCVDAITREAPVARWTPNPTFQRTAAPPLN